MNSSSGPLRNDYSPQQLAVHEGLFRIYEQMLGDVDITNVLQNTTRVIAQVLSAERATAYLVRNDSQELESVAIIGNVPRTIRIPISKDSIAGYCALTQRSFVIPDAYGDLGHIDEKLRFNRSWDEMTQFHTRDVMCAPAVFKDELIGVVQVINSKGNTFQQDDLSTLQSVSLFVAYALYHARLYDELATLKCLDKEKAEFMRILVHELRAPVAASKALTSSLIYTNRDDPKLFHVLTRIETRMDQLLNLVEDILQLSRIKAGRPLGNIIVCDLAEETRTTGEPYREEAKVKGLSMTMDLPKAPLPVRIDQQGYHLILSNLLSNALKYTPSGSVKVTLRREESWAVLEVADTGMGIPEGDISKLFTEFFRALNAIKSQIQGSGVGLAGIKELVERFGGELGVTSQENKGSTFVVRLPLHKA
jgi:signal transduction histidine kinase